jgi:carbon monoxide dehydrogenase subunit G
MVMARYVVHVRSPLPAAEAFAYMADLSNFAEWDPGVEHAELVQGDQAGPTAAFDVTVKGVRGSLTLRYHITEYAPPEKVVALAQSRLLTSLDTVTVRSDGDGSVVTYDAELKLNGLLRVADPLLGLSFKRIGDRAATGLVRILQGVELAEPPA